MPAWESDAPRRDEGVFFSSLSLLICIVEKDPSVMARKPCHDSHLIHYKATHDARAGEGDLFSR